MNNSAENEGSKICRSCGIRKPLSAFIQRSGLLAGTYGSICSACRSEAERLKLREDGSTTSTSGKKIDAEARIEAEAQKRELSEKELAEYYKERDKRDELSKKRTESTIEKSTTEKKLRDALKKPESKDTKPTLSADPNAPVNIAEQERAFDTTRIAQDTNVPKLYRQSAYFLGFTKLVKSAPISKAAQGALDRMQENNKQLANKETPKEQIDALEKSWKPDSGSKRR